jgi:hypothetical protein
MVRELLRAFIVGDGCCVGAVARITFVVMDVAGRCG